MNVYSTYGAITNNDAVEMRINLILHENITVQCWTPRLSDGGNMFLWNVFLHSSESYIIINKNYKNTKGKIQKVKKHPGSKFNTENYNANVLCPDLDWACQN
jgi:hypothetical protein